MLDMPRVREIFDVSDDFTVGLEEEFAILDRESLSLTPAYEQLNAAAQGDELLAAAVAGELIQSEIEIRSGRGESFAEAVDKQREARTRLFATASDCGLELGSTATHPWSHYAEQRVIDTDHYRRVEEDLQYLAWRNNTFSIHVHMGVRGADRAVRVCDRLRPVLPLLLAISANSPFLDGRSSGLHSARSQIFTKSFPRCGIPDAFGSFAAYADYVNFLVESGSIVEHTQIWWSVRPHHSFGTVELRICDAQTSAEDATALEGLIAACIAQAAIDEEEGAPHEDAARRLIEENFWRAIRYGLEGRLIDLERGEQYPAAAASERLMEWTAPARSALGIDVTPPEENGAQRQRRALAGGASIEEVYAAEVAETRRTFAAEEVKR